MSTKSWRVAAVGDLHCREGDGPRLRELVRAVNGEADVLVLCGDLTDRGLVDEAKILCDALAGLSVPCACVLGNHDFDAGRVKEVEAALHGAGATVLDGDHLALDGELGIAGVKGFGGGFGPTSLQAFGEATVKAFVQEAVSEALKLESALGQLDTEKRIAILHYSPILETTQGEKTEIRAFLGSSRLATPIDSFGADAVFHGHSHHGSAEGRTEKGVPVYNVAEPLLRRVLGKRFRVVDI